MIIKQSKLFSFICENYEKIFEKYIRRGASPRYKVSVKPVKLLVRCKGGKMCYRTYYAGNKKYSKYEQHYKAAINQNEPNPKAITYTSEVASRLTNAKVKNWQKKYLGHNFTTDLAHLSGNAYNIRNVLLKRQVATEIVENKFDKSTGTHTLKYINGTKISSQFLLAKDGRFKLLSDISNDKHPNVKEYTYHNEINGKISTYKDERGINRRMMNLNEIKNYNVDSFSGFLSHMQYKFGKINANLTNMSKKATAILLLHGFGDNIKVNKQLKNTVLNSIIKSMRNNKKRRKLLQKLASATTLADMMNILVKNGMLNHKSRILNRIASYVKSNYKKLTFSSFKYEKPTSIRQGKKVKLVHSKIPIYNTKSVNTFHSLMLQRSLDNDYHKGFILKTYKKYYNY